MTWSCAARTASTLCLRSATGASSQGISAIVPWMFWTMLCQWSSFAAYDSLTMLHLLGKWAAGMAARTPMSLQINEIPSEAPRGMRRVQAPDHWWPGVDQWWSGTDQWWYGANHGWSGVDQWWSGADQWWSSANHWWAGADHWWS